MSEPADLDALAATFFAAAQAGEWSRFRSLLADDGVFVQHTAVGGGESADELTASSMRLVNSGLDLRYENFRRLATGRIVVDRHEVHLTRPDGRTASTDVCVVLEFDSDDKIARSDEYLDTAAFASLFS